MHSENKNIKNWVSLQRARIGIFMKNHKYISAIIGLFIISAIIAAVVFASDEDPYEDTISVNSNGDIAISSTEKVDTPSTKIVKSYSTVIYDIPYKLNTTVVDVPDSENPNRTMKVTIKIPKSVDAEIFSLNNEFIQETSDSSNVIYTMYDYAALKNEQIFKLYMKVYNVSNSTEIVPEIKICENTATDTDGAGSSKCYAVSGDMTKVTVESEEIKLIPKTVVGVPYNSGTAKRYVPFGILVGFNEDDLDNGKLTGKYFNPDINLEVKALQATTAANLSTMSKVEGDHYYGLFAGQTNEDVAVPFLPTIPFGARGLGNNDFSLYDSGSIELTDCNSSTCSLFDDVNGAYKLSITGIKTDGWYLKYNAKGLYQKSSPTEDDNNIISGILSNQNNDLNDKFLAVGSYYMIGNYNSSFLNSSNDVFVNLAVKYSEETETGTETKDGISYYSIDSANYTVAYRFSTDIIIDDNVVTSDPTIAYGDEVVLKGVTKLVSFGTEIDSTQKYKVLGKVPVSAMTGISPFEMVEYSSEIESDKPYYLAVGNRTENLDEYEVSVKYISCTDSCTLDIEETEANTYDSLEAFNTAKGANSALKISYVKYEVQHVSITDDVDFRIRLKSSAEQFGEANLDLYVKMQTEEAGAKSLEFTKTKKIKVTPFKSRLNLSVDNNFSNVNINIASKANSKLAIYPSISLPAMLVHTNILQISKIDKVNINVTLPDGINYVPNNNYLAPKSISADGKTLTFELTDQKINDWIEPIYMDIKYDINVENRSYDITATISSETETEVGTRLEDVSSEIERTSKVSVNFINAEPLAYSMSASSNVVTIDEEFEINVELYNRAPTAQSGLELIYVLPQKDNGKSSFSGSYEIGDLTDENVLCTTASYTDLSNTNNLKNGAITWEACSASSSNITAIKVKEISVASDIYSHSISIKPSGSHPANYYTVEAYVITAEGVIAIKPVKVSIEALKISGIVWEDFDGNGILDTGEFKVPDVEFNLYDAETDELVDTTLSDKDGNYIFDQVSPESIDGWSFYVVANYNSARYAITQTGVGTDKSINSSYKMEGNEIEGCVSTENRDEDGNPIYSDDDDEEDEDDDDSDDDSMVPSLPIGSSCVILAKTEIYTVTPATHTIGNINLGLTPRKEYNIKMNKYISSAEVTNLLGVSNKTEYGKVSFAKLDVRDIGKVNIKVTYSIEIKNTGYFPGYIYKVKDLLPDGMTFNSNYSENAGWTLSENGYLENTSLSASPLLAGETRYLTLSLDLTRKEAGSFVNYSVVEDSDLAIYSGSISDLQNGGTKDEN